MANLETRAIRHMYQTEPRMFFEFVFELLHPTVEYVPCWATDVIGEALKRCAAGETRRLVINMPPRSLKSFCASVAFPAWLLGIKPDTKIMCVAGHKGLADDQHEYTRRLMVHPRYRSLFPHVQLGESRGKLGLRQGGYRAIHTTTGSLTGRGADMIIIDDPQSADETGDLKQSESIRRWYDQNIYQRLNDKNKGVVILVMQRLAHDDLTAHLLRQGGWEHIALPAIAMEDESYPRVFSDRNVRRKGEALNPKRESLELLRDVLMRIGAKPFMSQYQQNPYSPGMSHERCGAFHDAPYPDATEEECKKSTVFFARIPEEVFVLDRVFGERNCIRRGSPPPLSDEEWLALDKSIPSPAVCQEQTDVAPNSSIPKGLQSHAIDTSDHQDNRFGVRCEPCSEEDIAGLKKRSRGSWH